jgi:hypothetical protein
MSCKCRCFNCHTPDRHKETKNLSESLAGEEIVIDMVQKWALGVDVMHKYCQPILVRSFGEKIG